MKEKIEFIKKCIPFAYGFTLAIDESNPLNVPVIYIENNGFSKRYIVREKTFQDIIFPHFLTRTIEGINKNNPDYEIVISSDIIEIVGYRTFIIYDYDSIDDCKQEAINYILSIL